MFMLDCADVYPNDVKKVEWKYEYRKENEISLSMLIQYFYPMPCLQHKLYHLYR